MIVGRKCIPIAELNGCYPSIPAFIEFSNSLIDEPFKHVKEIQDNQLYLCCLNFRKFTNVGWKERKEFCASIMNNITVTGNINYIVETQYLMRLINRRKAIKFYEKERTELI